MSKMQHRNLQRASIYIHSIPVPRTSNEKVPCCKFADSPSVSSLE